MQCYSYSGQPGWMNRVGWSNWQSDLKHGACAYASFSIGIITVPVASPNAAMIANIINAVFGSIGITLVKNVF